MLRLVPYVDLSILDPITNTATVTRNHGYMVFDTLYGVDKHHQPRSQMLEGHLDEDDHRLWTLTLREGIRLSWLAARDLPAQCQNRALAVSSGPTLSPAPNSSNQCHHSGLNPVYATEPQ